MPGLGRRVKFTWCSRCGQRSLPHMMVLLRHHPLFWQTKYRLCWHCAHGYVKQMWVDCHEPVAP